MARPQRRSTLLEMDRLTVERHNSRTLSEPNGDDLELHTDVLPDPYGGDPEAPAVLLSHTGFSADDVAAHQEPEFRAAALANLAHQPSDWPLYPLNPDFRSTPAGIWWMDFTRALRARVPTEVITKRVFYLQLSPYHSKSGIVQAASRRYGRELLEASIERKALIIGLLARWEWSAAVPALDAYWACFWPGGRPRRPVLTEKNIGSDAWDRLIRRLES